MFTGIIEGLGTVTGIIPLGQERRFIIQPLYSLPPIQDGDSIAVNGVCLSIEKHDQHNFTVYASAETLTHTNLPTLSHGEGVNLELALAIGQRLGGHIVTGHIDCIAEVLSITDAGESLKLALRFPSRFAPLVIPKGSVALNGISLTINTCGADFLEVNIIPDSQKRTNLSAWRPGSLINMETDIIGKYIRRLSTPWQDDLSIEFLTEHGFI